MSYIRQEQSKRFRDHMKKFSAVASSSLEVIKPAFVLSDHKLALDAGFTEEDLLMLHALDNVELYSYEAVEEHWVKTSEHQLHLA